MRSCLLLLCAVAGEARASIAVLVGEPFGSFGTMMPLGHTAIYLDNVCADGPMRVKTCEPGEARGVVLSRYFATGEYDWLATPVMDFLYATQSAAEIPAFANGETVWAMRQRYRERYLRAVVPDGSEGVGDRNGEAVGARDLEEWWETAGMAYDRKFWVYEVSTTAEQDARLVQYMNARRNVHSYHLSGANCADFAAELMNVAYPGSVKRADRVADYGLMTPKHVVRSLSETAARHPEMDLHVWTIAQVPGDIQRSKRVWGGVESAIKTKRYLFPLLVLQPELPVVLTGLYLAHGRWKIGAGAQPMPGLSAPALLAGSSSASASGGQ